MTVSPLIFAPIFKPKIWGGRNLERILAKQLPAGEPIGESWECADLPNGQSIVSRGPAKGKTLHQLIEEWGPDLTGRAPLSDGRFPLLIKFLDAAAPLSIQVHPAIATAAAPIKHEAWYILDAADGAFIYRDLRPGVSLDDLREIVTHHPEKLPDCLQKIPIRPGDMYYLPSGTIHALGAGIVVAEIQTPSDVTFRLYDWGRMRPDADAGLHIEEALANIRAHVDPRPVEKRSHVTSIFTTVTRLVTCPSFNVEKVRFVEGIEQDIPYAELVCWIVIDGSAEIQSKGGPIAFSRGDVVVLPAALKQAKLKTLAPCTWLEVTFPTPSDLADFPHPSPENLRASPPGPIQINLPLA